MQEAEIICSFLFPADQQPPGPVEPGVGAFDFPAASPTAAMCRLGGLVCLARDMRRVSVIKPEELAELCKTGNKIDLIDVRTPAEFQEVHVEVARNAPLDKLDPVALMQSRNGSAQEPLYVICRSGARSQQACEKFLQAGFSNVVNVEGGTLACVQAGVSIVRGKKAMSLDRQVRITIGSLVVLGASLGWLVHPAFIGLAAFMGAGLIFAGVTDTCPLSMTLARMPWNQCEKDTKSCCTS